ncbi:MAG: squalene/phytoene synthase family protein [Gammaproteobacteria bacterium]
MSPGLAEAHNRLRSASADLRLAAVFAAGRQRVTLLAVLAIYVELREILVECADAGVARVKLGWWQEELELLARHAPRHPLCKLLDEHCGGHVLPTQTWYEITASVATDISAVAFDNFDEVERYCRQRGGALSELAAQIAGPQPPDTLQAARLLGQSWQLADIVLHAKEYARHGRNYFAVDDLRKYALSESLTGNALASAAGARLLEDYRRRALAMRVSATALAGIQWPSLKCGLVIAGLAAARLKKRAARQKFAHDATPELGAVQQLLVAWRSARRARPITEPGLSHGTR